MRRLIVLVDGTWKSKDKTSDRTNVERLHGAIRSGGDDGTSQVSRYFSGVGSRRGERVLGGGFGVGLSREIRNAYHWIVDNFNHGDELWFFGFSRGAYTVRSLAGLIRNVGVLTVDNADRVAEAYKRYRSDAAEWHPDGGASRNFRATYANGIVPTIKFLGVWDTVGALGVPTRGPIGYITRRRQGFHDVELSGRVENAFHALAIDEQRKAFSPTLWFADDAHADQQRVEQAWFVGMHSDVGGGSRTVALADAPLLWMTEHAAACGLELDRDRLPQQDPPPYLGPLATSRRHIFRLQKAVPRLFVTEPSALNGRSLKTHESVHPSVARRYSATSGTAHVYAPQNLVDYMSRIAGAPPSG